MPTTVCCYGFRIGELQCACLLDGYLRCSSEQDYPNRLRSQRKAAIQPVVPLINLLIDTGEDKILVDSGADEWIPGAGNLVHAMGEIGIQPGEITHVIITHAHPTNIGGVLDHQGRLVFANASFVMAREEWEFWFSASARDRVADQDIVIARLNLEPLKNKVILTRGEEELLPGFRVIPSPGHTPGHLAVSLQSAGDRLLHVGDAALQPRNLEHPDWLTPLDLNQDQAVESRRRLVELATRGKCLVLGTHFSPFPGLGKIREHGNDWTWRCLSLKTHLEEYPIKAGTLLR